MARRRPDVSREVASAELSNGFLRSWNSAYALDPESTPSEIARPSAIAGPLQLWAGPSAGLEARTLRWVSGVAVIVLLIAAANVTNLMLARLLYHRREVAVRLALGVNRWRLLRSYLTESVILAVLGAVTGIALAQWGGAALRRLFLQPGASLAVATDGRTLLVAGLLALAVGLITGLGPALLAMRENDVATLKTGPRVGTHRSRLRSALLITQAALSVVLLVGAGLFVKSLQRVRDLRLGYDPEPVVMAELNMRGTRLDDSARARLSRSVLEAAGTIPGVRRATAVSSIPFWSTSTTDLFVSGIDSVRRLGRFTLQTATPGYFDVMETRILRGRPFTAADRGGAPRVVVVSESMARALWPDRDAIGECLRVRADTMPCSTVIGVAEDAVQNSLSEEKRFRYYLPLEQADPARGHTLLIRMEGDPVAALEPVRKALQAVMPGMSYVRIRAFREIVNDQRRSWRVGATMFVAFGGLALLVAAVGLYGVIAYNVAQRMHELGVRIALGAQARDVIRLVVGQGVRVAVIGVVLGGSFALYAGRWVEPLLFQLSAKDPGTYGLVAGLLLVVALLASTIPAARATRADPNAALRSE
jgi:predicted permease